MDKEKIKEQLTVPQFSLIKVAIASFIQNNFTPCDSFINSLDACNDDAEIKKLFVRYKHHVYQQLGGSDDNDDFDEISSLQGEIEELEEELEEARIIDGSSLDDEFKRRFIYEYHNQYTPWELEELLKNGKKYLKHNENK